LLPVHSSSIFDTAQATVEAFARPVDDRQDPRGSGFWVQETNLGLFSDGRTDQPGYKAWSFGVVGGYELPATALGVLGVTVGGATSTIYPDKVDSAADLHANMMEAGIYWRATRGGFSANARLAGGDAFTLRADDVSGQGAAARVALKGENGSGAFAVEGGAETRDGLSIYDLRLAGHIQF